MRTEAPAPTGAEPRETVSGPKAVEPLGEARLPSAPGAFAPAFVAVAAGAALRGETLADRETCGDCHADILAQQLSSAHGVASFDNPIYRVSVERVRAAVGKVASRMCGGCHDPALLVDGALDREVDAADPRAHAGVTCRSCHGIESVTSDGNGSYTLRAAPIALPKKGDAASVEAHRLSARPLRSAAMCGSCHRAFLSEATGNEHFLAGMDDLGAWSSSAFGGADLSRIDRGVKARDCIGCHMQPEQATRGDAAAENGTVSSHRFVGGHTWLAAMLGDPVQLERQRALLSSAATIDVAGARIEDDGQLLFDVVVANRGAGHRFPGGVRDAQDTWIEVVVADARGELIAVAGRDHEKSGADPSAHVLVAIAADKSGTPLHTREVNRFAATVVDHTIEPRDSALSRYAFTLPPSARQPLSISTRLRHRSRNLKLQKLVCDAHRSAQSRAFGRARKRAGKPVLDPCKAQPVTDLASAQVTIGRGSAAPSPDWRRLYNHGVALSHAVQERLDEARPSLEAALENAAEPWQRAATLAVLAALEGRQGRVNQALERLEEAGTLAPGEPALAAIRGDALSRVWRFAEAADAYAEAAALAPKNTGIWRRLAIASGSAGRDREAFTAARRGLELAPRDADLLRVQAISLRSLLGDTPVTRAALVAFEAHRSPDRLTDVRIRCATTHAACERERDPVHVHHLRAPTRKR